MRFLINFIIYHFYSQRLELSGQMSRIRSFLSLRDFFISPIFSLFLELPAILLMILLLGYVHYYLL